MTESAKSDKWPVISTRVPRKEKDVFENAAKRRGMNAANLLRDLVQAFNRCETNDGHKFAEFRRQEAELYVEHGRRVDEIVATIHRQSKRASGRTGTSTPWLQRVLDASHEIIELTTEGRLDDAARAVLPFSRDHRKTLESELKDKLPPETFGRLMQAVGRLDIETIDRLERAVGGDS